MKKNGDIRLRIDETVKEEAESILKRMGISPAVAIDIFYRQIIFKKKMPFEISDDPKIHHSKDDGL